MTNRLKTTQPDPKYFGPFSEAFRTHVHLMISWGYADSRSGIKLCNKDESDITGYITGAVQNRLRAVDCPKWCEHYAIKENPPVEKAGSAGNRRLRPDIIIEGTFKRRPEYVFEAKRLRKNGFEVGKYIGSEGIGCFIDGRYAAGYEEAAMLGYVQSDSLLYWKEEIKKGIDKKKDELFVISPQQDFKVIDALPVEWQSKHNRDGKNVSITVFHILLDYRMGD